MKTRAVTLPKKVLRRRSKRPISAFNTDEMEEHSDGYVEFVLEQLEKAKQTCPDPLVLIEQKVDLSDFVPGSYGTADCLMVSDDTLHIIDAKYGLGVLVDAERNTQLMCYDIATLGVYESLYDIKEVSLSIFQPRRENVQTWTVSVEELKDWAENELKTKAQMAAKGEVLLTIMASLAQQESQSLSQNVKLGFQYRYQQGQMTVNHNRFLGFTKDEKGQLIIEPDEAVVVKRIYREYLEGASLQQIGRGLEADGILTGAGKKKWRPESLQKILKNEKYIGDALLQKTYTVDFLEKKRVPNNGIVPQYYVENSHEAIIPRDLYMQVQEEMIRRANLHSGQERKKRVYSSKYALSSIVYCSKCGDIYRRIAWNNRGKHSIM